MGDCFFATCPQCGGQTHFDDEVDSEILLRLGNAVGPDGLRVLDQCVCCGFGGVPRDLNWGGYTNDQVKIAIEEWPVIGELCEHCGKRLPNFLNLKQEKADEARAFVRQNRPDQAIHLIQQITQCPLTWARLWVEHALGKLPADLKGPPCPNCGKSLREKGAKHGLHCGLDWRQSAQRSE